MKMDLERSMYRSRPSSQKNQTKELDGARNVCTNEIDVHVAQLAVHSWEKK